MSGNDREFPSEQDGLVRPVLLSLASSVLANAVASFKTIFDGSDAAEAMTQRPLPELLSSVQKLLHDELAVRGRSAPGTLASTAALPPTPPSATQSATSQQALSSLSSSLANVAPLFPLYGNSNSGKPTALSQDVKLSAQRDQQDALFPYILHGVLTDAETAGQASIISWCPEESDTFQIHHPDLFDRRIMRMYFPRFLTLLDFWTQLEKWGFAVDRQTGRCRHPCFVRGKPSLCVHMGERPSTGTAVSSDLPNKGTSSNQSTPSALADIKNASIEKYVQGAAGSHSQGMALFASRLLPQARTLPSTETSDSPTSSRDILERLRELLNAADKDPRKASIISWLPDGQAFKVHDINRFSSEMLSSLRPNRQMSFDKFKRLLTRCGFAVMTKGTNSSLYFHCLFVRGNPSLCQGKSSHEMRDVMDAFKLKAKSLSPHANATNARQVKAMADDSVSSKTSSGEVSRPLKRKIDHTSKSIKFSDANANTTTAGPPRKISKTAKTNIDTPKAHRPTNETSVAQNNIVNDGPRHKHSTFLLNENHESGPVPSLLFPQRLHEMLDDAEKDEDLARIVAWQPDSVSFVIKDRNLLETQLLPKYFGDSTGPTTTWDSFIQTLSSWGFVRFTSGPNKGAYIHRLLVRGKKSLSKQMRINGKTVSELMKHPSRFLLLLHEVLCYAHKEGKQSIVAWKSDGRTFSIYDPTSFLKEVLSLYCDVTSFAAFEKNLRRWGFQRTPSKINATDKRKIVRTYYHPKFVRDHCPLVVRPAISQKMGSCIRPDHGFLVRLRVMLDEAHLYGHQLVVSWMPHGRAFLLHDRAFFSTNILPLYFKSKFTSFRQALQAHGFVQLGTSGWDEGAYYHKLFVRDEPDRCQGYTEEQMKKAMPDWIPVDEEPEFSAFLPRLLSCPEGQAVSSTDHQKTRASGVDFGTFANPVVCDDSGYSADATQKLSLPNEVPVVDKKNFNADSTAKSPVVALHGKVTTAVTTGIERKSPGALKRFFEFNDNQVIPESRPSTKTPCITNKELEKPKADFHAKSAKEQASNEETVCGQTPSALMSFVIEPKQNINMDRGGSSFEDMFAKGINSKRHISAGLQALEYMKNPSSTTTRETTTVHRII